MGKLLSVLGIWLNLRFLGEWFFILRISKFVLFKIRFRDEVFFFIKSIFGLVIGFVRFCF